MLNLNYQYNSTYFRLQFLLTITILKNNNRQLNRNKFFRNKPSNLIGVNYYNHITIEPYNHIDNHKAIRNKSNKPCAYY